MVNVANELKKLGIELTDEQKEAVKKSFGEKLYSEAELNDRVKKAESAVVPGYYLVCYNGEKTGRRNVML